MKKLILFSLLIASSAVCRSAGTITTDFDPSGGDISFSYVGGTGTVTMSHTVSLVGTAFLDDSFADANNVYVASHTPTVVGSTWSKSANASYSAGLAIITSSRARTNDASTVGYYNNAAPASADYYVEAVIYQAGSSITGLGPTGRMSTTADTMYWARYQSSSGEWQLYSNLAGVSTKLGGVVSGTSDGVSYTVRLSMVGTTISLSVNSSEIISVTDSDIAGPGKAGIRGVSQTGGHHIDSIKAVNQ